MGQYNVKKIFFISFAIIAAILIYWWRFNLAEKEITLASVDPRLEEKVEISGMINNNPEEGNKSIKFVLKSDDNKRYLVTTNLGDSFYYGEKVKVRGKLLKPENFI